MKFQGAVIKEQNVTFAIVVVKKFILDNPTQATNAIHGFEKIFPGLPIVLMAQNHKGIPSYYGRKDLTNFLSKLPLSSIPWKNYYLN